MYVDLNDEGQIIEFFPLEIFDVSRPLSKLSKTRCDLSVIGSAS